MLARVRTSAARNGDIVPPDWACALGEGANIISFVARIVEEISGASMTRLCASPHAVCTAPHDAHPHWAGEATRATSSHWNCARDRLACRWLSRQCRAV